jgi:iron-sulfur cluster assembly protein
VDRAADLVAEYVVDQLVLLDARETLEAIRDDLCAEVVTAAVQVLDLHICARKGLLDPMLELVRSRHGFEEVSRGYYLQEMVTLTTVAAEKVRGFLAGQETAGLRVGVRGGGCSGFQYALALDEPKSEDQIFDVDGIKIIVDEASLKYVDGSEVDYTESLMGSGFQVNNPNVVASCGCGSSFRIAEEEPSCGAAV